MRVVDLSADGAERLALRLRPVTGADELAISGADPGATTSLLARLAGGAEVASLTVSQIDRALAALHDMLYGDRAECRVRCGACGEGYEFTLALSAIIAAQDAERPDPPGEDGAWALGDGRRVRAPRPEDLAAGPEALPARLLVAGDRLADPVAVLEFLERAAPILTLDLDAACPHCGSAEVVRFDLARYLALRLANERGFLLRETHLIASRYGWPLAEIMGLTRDDRRAFAGLIEAERAGGQLRRAG